jgi:hypothetical protein
VRVSIQRWSPDSVKELIGIRSDVLPPLLKTVQRDGGSTLDFGPDDGGYPRIMVAVDRGRFMATATLGPDTFYDRLGDSSATGDVDFTIGGQLIDGIPARLVLGQQQVLAVLRSFVESGAVDVSKDWVRQGTGPWR